jgi:two-component system chemotaxis sensor kinase CheA
VVIKSLESNYAKVTGISGATILGDGRVALILDVSALVRRCSQVSRSAA